MSAAAVERLGIVGGGLAGLAAALAARAAGLQVEVYEAAAEPAPLPVPIDVVPNLLRDLTGLGLGEACVRRGFPYQGTVVMDAHGRRQFELPTPHLAGPRWPAALGMVYGELLALMREAALARGVRLHGGRRVSAIDAEGRVWFGEQCTAAHELVVLASGAELPVLPAEAARPVPVEALPQQWCQALLPRPLGLEQAAWVLSPGPAGPTKALLVPVDARRVGLVLQQPAGSDTRPAAIRARLAGTGPWLQRIAAEWTDATPTLMRPVSSGLLDGPWHAQGVLRVGHAAHVLPPQFGQAAAQTVEDAVVLGALLREQLPRELLLDRFTQRRAERARQVHAVVTQAARWDLHPEAATDLPALAQRLAQLIAEPA